MRFLIFILALVIPSITAQNHFSTASAGVSFGSENNGVAAAAHAGGEVKIRNRRMYAMCPPLFQRIGTECYSMPEQRSSWLEAHFFCKDKNSKLAEPQKFSNRKLSSYLQQHDAQMGLNDPIWIGATYDWQSNVWQWSISGKNLSYDAFSQMDPESRKNLENHCAVYDPNLQYRWSARSCPDKHRFICQHKMPKVSEKNRYKVYDRWNATYPNQMANEVILEVIDRRSKNSGKINRTVQAIDSKEEMPVRNRRPPGNMQRRRRPSQKQSVNLPSENDTNYQQPSAHPNDINYRPTRRRQRVRPSTSTTPASPVVVYNEILPQVTEAPADVQNRRRQERLERRHRTNQDRKLEQQREKERRRLQRKAERQEKMRLRKHQQQQRLREEQKQQQNDQQHNQLDELRQKESEAEQHDTRRLQQPQDDEARRQTGYELLYQPEQEDEARHQMERQQQQRDLEQRQRELEALKQQHADAEKKRQEDQEEEYLRNERIRKQHERDEQIRKEREQAARKLEEERAAEDLKHEQARLAEEQRLKEEYEENLKQAQSERERKLHEEHEQKRLMDEHNRRQLELEAKQREENIKREQEEEEKRMELKRLENANQLEQRELQRLHEEKRHREEVQRKREEEIARREADQRQIEADEERIRQELDASEKERLRQHEEKIKREEEAEKAIEESKRRAEEEKLREREERFDVRKRQEDERVRQELIKKRRSYAERIAHLSPEDQKKFFEMRKQRKSLKEKKAKEFGANSNNEAFIPNSAE